MHRRVIALAAGLLLAAATAPTAQPAPTEEPLQAGRVLFEKQSAAIEIAGQKAREQAGAAYLQDLREILTHLQKAGDDFGVRPAQEEIKRFERTKTLPAQPEPGTPELLLKARERYQQALAAAETTQADKTRKMTEQYVAFLKKLRADSAAGGRSNVADRVTEEIARVAPDSAGAEEEPVSAAATSELRLPTNLVRGVALAYNFSTNSGSRVRDVSGRRRHGTLVGTRRTEEPGGKPLVEFLKGIDALQTPPIPVGHVWTVAVRARFPLEPQPKPRVLASAAFRQDHVVVDESGMLGTAPGDFVGCGYRVSELKGWHEIVAVGRVRATEFYVDGQPVGVAKAVCAERLTSIGNSAGGGRPWGGAIRSVTVWLRALTRADVAELAGNGRPPAPPPEPAAAAKTRN